MSREQIRRLRKDMPDPTSDSVIPTANDRTAAVEQMPSDEVVGLPTEADSEPIVAQGANALALESELPPQRHSGRLTAKDFHMLTDCSICRRLELTAAWVWQKSTLLGTDGIVQDRSAQKLLQRTLICEGCYECVSRDGGIQMDEGWWIFDTEHVKSEPDGASVDNHTEDSTARIQFGDFDEVDWLPADASQE